MARKLKVWVDHQACVGNAMCESIAPKVFRLNDNRQSEVVDPAADTEEKILEAAENCPVSAIFVEDAETGERLFPQPVALHPPPPGRSPAPPRCCAPAGSSPSRPRPSMGSAAMRPTSAPSPRFSRLRAGRASTR